MEEVVIRYLGSDGQYQNYSPNELALINKSLITANYGNPNDYVEYFVKDVDGLVLAANYADFNYDIGDVIDPVTGTTTRIYVDPENDAKRNGYDRGIVNVKYNFLRTFLSSNPVTQRNFWIKEISTSRTEIKVARQDLSNEQLQTAFNDFNTNLAADAYYPEFFLNFGNDILLIAVNAVYIEEDAQAYILFKLYEPLPEQFSEYSTFWVVTQVAESAEFNVDIKIATPTVIDTFQIKGPNYKVSLNDTVNQTTPYYNYTSLFATSVTSSFQQLKSMMDEKGIMINVDYSSFSNFVHFSSATERIYNFVYKLQLIESASMGLTQPNTLTAKLLLQSQIDNTIKNFDGYEYYLYYESESFAWPKRTSVQPYELYSVTSSQASNWLGSPDTSTTPTTASLYYSASYYDNTNSNLLDYTAPQYLRDDDSNAPYFVFLNMIGQHFDNIWIYLKDVTNRYSAENNPFVGISMDQVANALKSFGIRLYTNTSITDNIYYSLLGINADGSLLPPTGSEVITNYVTSSIATLPGDQITGEVYKRLYHNLAYLLKTRGTERGTRALVTTYGIPESILTTHEYGGYNIYQVAGIQEIDNIKIVTGSILQLSSSLLSPYATIQYYDNNLDKSSTDVQIGFSPADSINASITSSGYVTSSTQPGYFNIMQYIGAPDLQYSSSYTPLVQLSNTYFDAEYTSRYDVWDFIRVIKYYNNSLFKMLRDWVPARSSADTGIVIKSHILERNKYPRKEPTYTTSSYEAVYKMVEISGSDGGSVIGSTAYVEGIPVQYSAYSNALSMSSGIVYVSSSDDIQKYNGEFSGSTIFADVNYFPQEEQTSYNFPWTSSVPPSQHGGKNIMFSTYSLGATFQNITGSVISQRFLDLDYNSSQLAPVNYGLITKSLSESTAIGPVLQSTQPYSQYAQYQDYNHNFRPITIPRYSGSMLSGLYYNKFTEQNATYSGDISFGKDPVIEYYSSNLGLFTQIASSSFLPGKVNATIAYFADVSGGLFELNQNNRNWQDVQNIFVAGETVTIKQFDNKKYSNQVSTDGIKTIYNSGYNYTPQLYFVTGSQNIGADTKLYFEFTGDATSLTGFTAYNNLTPPSISGSLTVNYPVVLDPGTTVRAGNIYNILDTENPATTDFTPGTSVTFPSYTASQAGQKSFTINMGVNFDFPDPSSFGAASGSYSFGAYLNDITLLGNLQTVNFTSSFVASGFSTGSLGTTATPASPTTTPSQISETLKGKGPFNWSVDGAPATTIGDQNSQISCSLYSYQQGGTTVVRQLIRSMTLDMDFYFADYLQGNPTIVTSLTTGGNPTSAIIDDSETRTINYTTPITNFNPDDKVVFRFRQEGMSTNNFTSSVTTGPASGYLTINNVAIGQGGYPYATSSLGNFIDDIQSINDFSSNIIMSTNLTQYLGYQFVPFFESGSTLYTSSLYNVYGDINNAFNPLPGDKIILSDASGIVQDLDVLTAVTSSSQLQITVVPGVLDNWIINPANVLKFLLLRRYKDEQNVILTFNKTPGQTSYGFLLPETVSPQVTNNINTLQAAVQSQLLSNQSPPSIDTINGGSFS